MGDEVSNLRVEVLRGLTSSVVSIYYTPEQEVTLVFTADFKQFRYIELGIPHNELYLEFIDGFIKAMELAKRYATGEIGIPL